jgi:broad specificity phosphatase PhoE
MRIFLFARHGESSANVSHVLNSDPTQPAALTARGRKQARRLGAQIANMEIDIAFCSRFPRTRETAELALCGREVPIVVDPGLDEIQAGVFDSAPIEEYWAWKDEHPADDPFPGGESLDHAVRRYVDSLYRLINRTEAVTMVVTHELPLRYIVTAAAGPAAPRSEALAHGALYLFDGLAVGRAAECLDVLAAPASDEITEAA